MANLGFGLIGTGFMGRTHAIALQSVATVFAGVAAPRLVSVADHDADDAAHELRFERSTGDWRELLEDPAIDVIDICAPNDEGLRVQQVMATIEESSAIKAWVELPRSNEQRELPNER